MSVQITFAPDQPVIQVHFDGVLSVDDMRQVIVACLPALSGAPHSLLLDMSHCPEVDPHVLELSSLSELLYHPNARWFVYVKPTRLFRSLMQVRHRGNSKSFEQLDDALAFLQRAITPSG